MWLPSLLLLSSVATAELPRTVVTFDNGGFNGAFYAPRWTGFAKPSVAREVATSIGRAAGKNPEIWTYLPPGAVPGRPGDPHRILPRRDGCVGPADAVDDPCWCAPGDRCWSELDVNRDAGGSTSLYLTAASVREREPGPRIEIHFTDLFEEDPSSAENPADSDRCVTRSGARKAVEGLMSTGGSVDHLAIGLLRIKIDPPPPGRTSGATFAFEEAEGDCWTGRYSGAWQSGREPHDFAMAVVVLGVDTGGSHVQVSDFLEALEGQLNAENMALSLVRLREPVEEVREDGTVDADAVEGWVSENRGRPTTLDCESVDVTSSFELDGEPITGATASSDCSGSIEIGVRARALRAAWARAHWMDPTAGDGVLKAEVQVRARPDGMLASMEALSSLNETVADRPLPMWDVVEGLAHAGGGMQPYRRDLDLEMTVTDLDRRNWQLALIVALVFGLATLLAAYNLLRRTQANRAYQDAWNRSVGEGEDPLKQRPIAMILADAQEEVRRGWVGRSAISAFAAAGVSAALFLMVLGLNLYLVANG